MIQKYFFQILVKFGKIFSEKQYFSKCSNLKSAKTANFDFFLGGGGGGGGRRLYIFFQIAKSAVEFLSTTTLILKHGSSKVLNLALLT